MPIGRPIANLACYILDGNLEPVPVGVLGELYLAGRGLARGYHQRPGLTAERFVASPFVAEERMYRTGDLARYRADRVIEYAGRIDHQVKLRGLRIELGEIEARLLEHPWVREAAVLAVDGRQLVGYVVLESEGGDWREALAAHLATSLPEYMVPAQWLALERMPLSPNGKLDRKALPKIEAEDGLGEYVAPASEPERQLAAIWADVLGRERVGVTDNFFALGGDSIVSIQVVSQSAPGRIATEPARPVPVAEHSQSWPSAAARRRPSQSRRACPTAPSCTICCRSKCRRCRCPTNGWNTSTAFRRCSRACCSSG